LIIEQIFLQENSDRLAEFAGEGLDK
jgi:hypothetical protein